MGNKSSKIKVNYIQHSIFKRIDNALAKYYKQCGRDDYYDENDNGKFIVFMHVNNFKENQIESQLVDIRNANDCLFIEMDPAFPLINEPTNKFSPNYRIFKILQHCYRAGEPPQIEINKSGEAENNKNEIERLLELPSKTQNNNFTLQWYHIENAIKQELYDEIASTFIKLVNSDKQCDDID
eukprot:54917_1